MSDPQNPDFDMSLFDPGIAPTLPKTPISEQEIIAAQLEAASNSAEAMAEIADCLSTEIPETGIRKETIADILSGIRDALTELVTISRAATGG